MKKIWPLGERSGPGSFDAFWKDAEKYPTYESAVEAGVEIIVIDFVQDEEGIIYFQFMNTHYPEKKVNVSLLVQYFPYGIDQRDEWMAQNVSQKMYK